MSQVEATAEHRSTSSPLDEGERLARLLLWCVEKIGPMRYRSLLKMFGSAAAALEAGPVACAAALRSASLAAPFDEAWPRDEVRAQLLREMSRLDLIAVAIDDPAYPSSLAELGEPAWLFVAGRPAALDEPLAAIVGTRGVRPDGVRLTRRVVGWCGDLGWATVSGGALGVDTEVHRASLEGGFPTVVVLPAGHAHAVPASNRRLFDSVCAAGGCLVSEHPPWRSPRPELFARRNRLISGLSVITLIVRAPLRSGALITAEWAWRQGRPVYVVPGTPDDPTAAGCLEAMRRGGRLLAASTDLPAAEGLARRKRSPCGTDGAAQRRQPRAVSKKAEAVLACLSSGPAPVDELVARTGLRPEVVVEQLGMLVLDGRVEQIGPGLYRAR